MTYALFISSTRCRTCGNTWTSSEVIQQTDSGYSFTSNHPAVTHSLTGHPEAIECYKQADYEQPLCWKCVNVFRLPKDWPRLILRKDLSPARSQPRVDVEDLLK